MTTDIVTNVALMAFFALVAMAGSMFFYCLVGWGLTGKSPQDLKNEKRRHWREWADSPEELESLLKEDTPDPADWWKHRI